MSDYQDGFPNSSTSEPGLSDSPHMHHYDNVNLSENATAVLGNVYYYQTYQQTPEVQPDRASKSLLSVLAYPDMHSRFQTLNDPYPDTFEWILSSSKNDGDAPKETSVGGTLVCWDSFTDWLKDASTPYWISGKLGTGKSTLVKYIVEGLSCSQNGYGETESIIVLSHFFWAPGSALQKSVHGCLRTLLWQLLQVSDGRYDQIHNINQANVTSTKHLHKEMIKLFNNSYKTIVVFLDGLDECSETEDTLDLIESLAALPHIKLCISSRCDEAYVLHFSNFAKLRLQDLNEQDILCYVKAELLENPRLRRSPSWNAKFASDLADSVIKSAEGVFLWVRLVIKELFRGWTNRDDLPRMQKRLQKLPQDIYKLYTQLTRRLQEDGTEYARDAAIYYQLLAQSPDHKLPLATFFFATNDATRARYMNLGEILDLPLETLERDVDLESLITWINVRTAGLLEVKEDDDVFQFNNENRPGPSGKFFDFQKHWVSFIHRSAYTYLMGTVDGEALMKELPITLDALKTIFFESQVATLLIVPGTYGFRFGGLALFCVLFPLEEIQSCFIRQWCEVLQKTCDILLAKGLIITSRDWLYDKCRKQYPSSVYRSIDLCMLCAANGPTAVAELFAHLYDCQDDQSYMSEVRLAVVSRQFWFREGIRKDDVSLLISSLRPQTARLSSTDTTQSKEQTSLSFRVAQLAYYIEKSKQDDSSSIWEFLEEANCDFPLLLTTSKMLIENNIQTPHSFAERYISIQMQLSIETLRRVSRDEIIDLNSGRDQALFFHDPSSEFGQYRVIHQDDSHKVLACAERMLLDAKGNDSDCTFMVHPAGAYNLSALRDLVLSGDLGEIYDRSIHCDCFVECLRLIGKTEETIVHAVSEQVKIAAHRNWDETRDFRFFHQLLGRDPEILASWIQKCPAMNDCPGILPE